VTVAHPASPTEVFERERRHLFGLAYRMLGTVADAEDVVQDAWLRWQARPEGTVERPEAWLTTVTTRLALDHLRAARRRRESYVGPWLPEPVVTDLGPAETAELADSLRLGFLAVLDELKPVERAVFLLADVFDVPFAEIASTVGKTEAACRQIAHRARRRVTRPRSPRDASADRAVVEQLLVAIAVGDTDRVLACVAPDVVCVSDGGRDRRAARRPVVGAARVARFMINLARRHAEGISVEGTEVNGEYGVLLSFEGEIDSVLTFEVERDRVARILIVRNPEKLARIGRPTAID
jgi:RNA polymerase sigma-70 factor, ECF subfamily